MNQQHSNYERAARSVFILVLSFGVYVWVGHTISEHEFYFGGGHHATSSERITPGNHPIFFWSWQAIWTGAAVLLDLWCVRDLIHIRRARPNLTQHDV